MDIMLFFADSWVSGLGVGATPWPGTGHSRSMAVSAMMTSCLDGVTCYYETWQVIAEET